jgi:hypothetical protein
MILLISAFQVARIIGMSHQCQAAIWYIFLKSPSDELGFHKYPQRELREE